MFVITCRFLVWCEVVKHLQAELNVKFEEVWVEWLSLKLWFLSENIKHYAA